MAQVSKINMGGIDYDIRDKVLEQEVANIKPIVNQGTINNAADEEDIASVDNLLKLKDRTSVNGMGYVILRKNKTFAEQVTKANTIYEIRYDFDLFGVKVSLPNNCVLKFEGGMLINGTIVLSNTNSIVSAPVQIVSSVNLEGVFNNTDQIRTSWFGGLSQCLTHIQKLYNGNNLQIDVIVDTQENITSTIVIKRGKMRLIFLKDVTTTINDGTPILEVDSTTSDNISFLSIVDFKVNYAFPSDPKVQNCVGIKVTGGNQMVSIVRPRIYFVETGILFAAKSSYLSKVVDATIIECNIGVHVKKVNDNWQNGLYFSFADLSKNSIGFFAEQGGRNTLEFKCSEVGSNDIGIKIAGGYYELIGTQWNENAITSSLVVEGDGVVRLTGNSGINNIAKIDVADSASLHEDKGQEMYPVRDIVDQRNLSFAINFEDGYINEVVSGARLPIVRGRTTKFGDCGLSFYYDQPSGNHIHNGYIDIKPIVLKNGGSIVLKGLTEVFTSTSPGLTLELTNDKTLSNSNESRYRIIMYFRRTYYAMRIFKGANEIASAETARSPIIRFGQITHAIIFNHLSFSDIYYHNISNLEVAAEYIDALKECEFKHLRLEGNGVSNESDVLYVNSILAFAEKTSLSSLRYIAENNVHLISDVKKIGTTAERPTASIVGAGFMYFDTDLSKPIYSTGNKWVDAMGSNV